MISIFDLEKRFDYFEEHERIIDYIENVRPIYIRSKYMSLRDFADYLIHHFPLNESSRNLEEYFNDYGFYNQDSENDIQSILLELNFYYTFIRWIYSINLFNPYSKNESESFDYLEECIRKIDWFLEKANYQSVETDFDDRIKNKKIIFIKRDADVDSVLHIAESSVKIDILSYLDFTIENNVEEKQNIVRRLYISIDTQTEKQLYYSNNCKKQYDDVIRVMNYVRHGQEEKLNDKDLIDLCDKVFYMYLHLIRTPIIARYRKDTIGLIAD